MKNLYIAISLIAIGLLGWGCSDDDTESDKRYAVFVQDKLNLPYTAGEVVVQIEWSATSWEISMDEDKGIIAQISPNKGGNSNEKKFTPIELQYNINPNKESRTQELNIKNLTTGEISKLTIVQKAKDDTYSLSGYYVSNSGSDYANGSKSAPFKTIAKAAAVAQAGDTVFIEGGTYSEQSIIPAKSGTVDAMIVFKPASSQAVRLIHPATSVSDNTAIFDLTNRNYIRIEGLQFADFKYGKASIFIDKGMGNVIINNRFENLGNNEVSAWNCTSVIFLYYASKNVIRNNYFNKITGDGIGVNDTAGENLISENTFTNFYGKPRSWSTSGSYSSAITCQETKTGDNIFVLNYGEKLKNFIWYDRNGSDNIALRNVGYDSNSFIFNESRCARNVIQENIAYNISATAYETARYEDTQDTQDARWINNVSYNSKIGYYVDKSHRDEFRNNITVNSTNYNLTFTARASQNGPHIFENNLWYSSNKVNSIQFKGSAVSATTFGTQIGEINTISSDPLFMNPSQGDFRLSESSPAKGAGSMGIDLGAYAVYGKTEVGYNQSMQSTKDVEVEFSSIISSTTRTGVINVEVTLNKIAGKPISIELNPIAGDARQNIDLILGNQTVNFSAGEISKTVSISFQGTANYDQLVAFRLGNAVNAQIGPKNIHVVRIKK